MEQQALLTLAIAIAALTLKPGPGMMLLISHTLSQGLKGCIAVLLGAQLVNLVFLGIVFLGFNALNVDMLFISLVVKSMTAVYLIWLGVQGLRDFETDYKFEETREHGFFDSLTASMALTASNPLVIIFYAGIFPTIFDLDTFAAADVLTIISVIVLVEVGVALAYSLPLLLFRYKVTPNILRKMSLVSSITVIFVGLYIGYTAIPAEDLKSVF